MNCHNPNCKAKWICLCLKPTPNFLKEFEKVAIAAQKAGIKWSGRKFEDVKKDLQNVK